jgi:hypothetical protein
MVEIDDFIDRKSQMRKNAREASSEGVFRPILPVFSFQSVPEMCYSKGRRKTRYLIVSGYFRGYSGVRG